MEQLDIKIEPEIHNDDTPHVHNMQQDTFLNCDAKIKYECMLHDEFFIKDDPDSDFKCSELIDDTQVMCASTSQSSDGVAMHIKEEPASDVGYDEPAPLSITQLMDATRMNLIGPCAGYVRLANIMWPAHPAAQQECLHCCIPVYRQTASGIRLLPVPLMDDVKDSANYLEISSIQHVHKQEVVLSRLSTDDVCVSGNSDCPRQVIVKEHAKCNASVNTYQCDVCHKYFNFKHHFYRHINSNKCMRKVNVKEYAKYTASSNTYQCDVCHKCFSFKHNLKRHIYSNKCIKKVNVKDRAKYTARGITYQCDVCHKRFSDNHSLQRHIRTHTGEKPYKCDMCDKSFNCPSNFQRHIRTHTGEKPYKCDICNKFFPEHGKLIIHRRTHTGEKPYKCDRCNKTFSHSTSLKGHILTHTGKRPKQKCDICNRILYSCSLEDHTYTHSGEKPYKCNMCGKSFTRSYNLHLHIHSHIEKHQLKCKARPGK